MTRLAVSTDLAPRTLRSRRAVDTLCLAAVLLAVAYVALPLWLPTPWLARRLADQLSATLYRPVRIHEFRVSWSDGVVINGLTIGQAPGTPGPYLARIRQVRCGFEPLATLFSRKLDQIQLVDPEVWLTLDADGRLTNLDDLFAKPARLPSFRYSLRGAACHLLSPQVRQSVHMDTLDCALEPRTGLLRLVGSATLVRPQPTPLPPTARFSLDARLTVTRLRRDRTLGGTIHLEWRDLALTDLPLVLFPRLPVQRVDGLTTGRVSLAPQPDLGIDFDLLIRLDRVRLLRQGLDRPAQVPDAEVRARGHWDPAADRLILQDLDYRTPGLHLWHPAGPHPAVFIDRGGKTPWAVHLAARVNDWRDLRREVPEIDRLLEAMGCELSGQADLALDWIHQQTREQLRLSLDAGASRVRLAATPQPYLFLEAKTPARLFVDADYDRAQRTRSRLDLRATLAGTSVALKASASLPVPVSPPSPYERPAGICPALMRVEREGSAPDPWPALVTLLASLEMEIELRAGDLQEVLAAFPFLSVHTGDARLSGPARLTISVLPRQDASDVSLAVELGQEAAVIVPGIFAKPAGSPADLRLGAAVPHARAGAIIPLTLEASCARGRLAAPTEPDAPTEPNAPTEPDAPARAIAHYSIPDPGRSLSALFARLKPAADAAVCCADQPAAPADGPSPGLDPPAPIELGLEIPLHVDHVEDLLAVLPGVRSLLNPQTSITGSADLTVGTDLSYRPGDWLLHEALQLDAGRLAVHCPDRFTKPSGAPLELTLAHRAAHLAGRTEHWLEARAREPAVELAVAALLGRPGDAAAGLALNYLALRGQVRGLPASLDRLPPLARQLAGLELRGKAAFQLTGVLLDGRQGWSASVDADDADFVVPAGSVTLSKPAGAPASGRIRLETEADPLHSDRCSWNLVEVSARLPGLTLIDAAGPLVISPGHPWPRIESASLKGRAELSLDDDLGRVHPQLRAWRDRNHLAGRCRLDGRLGLQPGALGLSGTLDLAEAACSIPIDDALLPAARKPAGTPAALTFDVTLGGAAPDLHLDIGDLTLNLDGNAINSRGRIDLLGDAAGLRLRGLELATTVDAENLELVPELLPDSPFAPSGGACTGTFQLSGAPGRWALTSAQLDLNHLTLATPAEDIRLDGALEYQPDRLTADQLHWAWGPSEGGISGTLRREDGAGTGDVGLAFDRLDLIDLQQRLAAITPALESTLLGQGAADPARLLRAANRLNLVLQASARTCRMTLPLGVDVTAEEGTTRVTADRGAIQLSFRAIVDGGLVTGSVSTRSDTPDPDFHLAYTAERIQPGPLVDRYLVLTFPGMHASGPLTLIDESTARLLPSEDAPNYPIGSGEMTIDGGSVEGRAAPLWVTRIFPGLNMARFDFSSMHSWFEKFADGRIRHQMIYRGRVYNIYMIGLSTPDGCIDYEVGVDFLARFDSKYWAESGQGRVPLFRKTGRNLPDGTLADEVVTYSTPQRILDTIFVKNNPVVTAYHAVRKRVLKER